MEWEEAAKEIFVKMPLQHENFFLDAKMAAEYLASKNGHKQVTIQDIEKVKGKYFIQVSETDQRKELEKRVAGDVNFFQRMEQSARRILDKDSELFQVETCYTCKNTLLSLSMLSKLKDEISSKFKELRVTERIYEKLPGERSRVLHNRINVALSGCQAGCSFPETKTFGVVLVSMPMVTDAVCSGCFDCVDACSQGAIVIRGGAPKINNDLCDHCGACVKACPTGTLESFRQGYRILVGGKLGRLHQRGFELYKMADRETLFKALEASVDFFLTRANGPKEFTALLRREGLSPIYQRIYQS